MATKREIERLIRSAERDTGGADLDSIAETYEMTREELYSVLAPPEVLHPLPDGGSTLAPLADLCMWSDKKTGWFFRYGPAHETFGPYKTLDAAIKAARDE